MRELTIEELNCVAGGTGTCTPENSGGSNDYSGITDTSSVGEDLIQIYEGLVMATSHVIERVAEAL